MHEIPAAKLLLDKGEPLQKKMIQAKFDDLMAEYGFVPFERLSFCEVLVEEAKKYAWVQMFRKPSGLLFCFYVELDATQVKIKVNPKLQITDNEVLDEGETFKTPNGEYFYDQVTESFHKKGA